MEIPIKCYEADCDEYAVVLISIDTGTLAFCDKHIYCDNYKFAMSFVSREFAQKEGGD